MTDEQRSLYLHAFLTSETQMQIKTKDEDEEKLVRRLFSPADRKSKGRIHIVKNIQKYADIPVVKNAMKAFHLQYTLEGTCPALQ